MGEKNPRPHTVCKSTGRAPGWQSCPQDGAHPGAPQRQGPGHPAPSWPTEQINLLALGFLLKELQAPMHTEWAARTVRAQASQIKDRSGEEGSFEFDRIFLDTLKTGTTWQAGSNKLTAYNPQGNAVGAWGQLFGACGCVGLKKPAGWALALNSNPRNWVGGGETD